MLQARGLQGGAVTYYLRITTTGRRERIPMGTLDYRDAVRRASELSLRYQNGERDLYVILKEERAERERQREHAKANDKRTLGALLTAYCDQLTRDEKQSAKDVRNSLRLHVAEAWPKLWETQAERITTDNLLDVLGRLTDAGKATRARQIRASLRAAYGAAIRARRDASALPALRSLHINANPAADLAPVKGGSNTRERALSIAELRAYWSRISAMPDIDGALLQFHLLTGGQRIRQLARATTADYDRDLDALRLLDGKGRRSVARVHMVPLIPEALDAMRVMHGTHYVFTVTAGESGATYGVVNKRLQTVVKAMEAAGELEHGLFTLGDLRRTVETRLSAADISQTVRAHLQSHGLGGVQARHYDRHDYLKEKRSALETLHRIASGQTASVTRIRKREA